MNRSIKKDIAGKNLRTYFIFLGALLIFSYLTMCYMDVTVAPRFGVTFIESLFDGKPLSFYANSNMLGINAEGANYDMGYFILYGIWDIPVYLLNHFFGVDTGSAGCLLWYKLLLVIFLFASIWQIRAITELCGAGVTGGISGNKPDESSAAGLNLSHGDDLTLLYLTAPTIFFPVFVACQCDIMPIFFSLAATRRFMQGQYRQCIGLMAIAMTFKPFPLFWLLLLILYKNRNPFKIIFDFACGCSLFVLSRLLYKYSPSFPDARQAAMTEDPKTFFAVTFPAGAGEVSVFFVAVLLIYIVAYAHQSRSENKGEEAAAQAMSVTGSDHYRDNQKLLLCLYGIWTSFVLFVPMPPYWSIYFAPAAVLLIYLCQDETMMLVELIGSAALTATYILDFSWVYGGGRTFYYLLLHGLFENEQQAADGNTIAGLLRAFNIQSYEPILNAIYAACFIYIGISAYKKLMNKENVTTDINESGLKMNFALRLLFLYGFVLVTLGAMVMTLQRN